MSRYVLRVDPARGAPAGATMLDWFGGSQRSTVQSNPDLLEGLAPSAEAVDLLSVAVAAYCADRLEPRLRREGCWSRDLAITVPVAARESMERAASALTQALSFLTSDQWALRLTGTRVTRATGTRARAVDAVCLFSGGLDSLAGAVDLLENGATVCLLSHYEGGLAPRRQRVLVERLRTEFGPTRIVHRKCFLRPAPFNRLQARPLGDDREDTSRGRSLLFIGAGVAVATGYGPGVPLYVPENGLIGINVPLTGARPASLSTRTTHPYLMDRLRLTLDRLGISTPLRNPYQLATKGEMLFNSSNRQLLSRLAPISLSCAHPEAGRLHRRRVGNCGYCFPCLIRRAAMHRIGADEGGDYAIDAIRDPGLLDLADAGADLRALLLSLGRPARELDVLRNGPIRANLVGVAETHRRGRRELRTWLLAGGHSRIQSALARAVQ